MLSLSPSFSVPDDIVVAKLGILATSGAGKSNTAVVLAEEMYANRIPWVAVDPKGDWWGIRSGADGRGTGLSVPVLGGLHGDVPLEPTAGKLVANLIVDRNLSCVVDVSEFDTLQETWRFLTDFAATLLRRNRTARHVFAEEAADYLPQTQSESGWLPKCRSAWRRIVSHGRNHGLGITLVSQRSAKIDKDALDLVETLIAMRATSPRDLAAIRGWVKGHDVEEDLVESLPTLDDGEAWVWSPHTLRRVECVQIRRRSTFDSGATPLLAADALTANLTPVDLDVLKEQMADTIERAAADDPGILRARIRDLERDLSLRDRTIANLEQRAPAPAGLSPEMSDRLAGLADEWTRIGNDHFRDLSTLGQTLVDGISAARSRMMSALIESVTEKPPTPVSRPAFPDRPEGRQGTRTVPEPSLQPVSGGLGRRERAILTALVQHGRMGQHRIALLTGYSPRASTISAGLATLRKLGYVSGTGDQIAATTPGISALGAEPLPEGRALLDYWLGRLGRRESTILRCLLDRYPDSASVDEVANATGYSPAASTISAGMATLRGLGLVDGWAAAAEFVEAIR